MKAYIVTKKTTTVETEIFEVLGVSNGEESEEDNAIGHASYEIPIAKKTVREVTFEVVKKLLDN